MKASLGLTDQNVGKWTFLGGEKSAEQKKGK
jgi:hypothetical protein